MFNVLANPIEKIVEDLGNTLIRAWFGLWRLIDTLIYNLISTMYQVFSLISRASLFNGNSEVDAIVSRFSMILGIGMLFVLAYNIILLIMNPDKVSSGGDKSLKGIAKNFVIAVVMLTCYSTVFNYMTKLQNDIIESQVIENIILGGDGSSGDSLKNMGSKVATMVFSTFWHPLSDSGDALSYQECLEYVSGMNEGNDSSEKSSIFGLKGFIRDNVACVRYVDVYQKGEEGNFGAFIGDSVLFAKAIKGEDFEYLYIISSICGVIALLMFVSYTIDIGIRVAKLAFLQIIAPIPIMLYVTKPNGGIFSKWINVLIKTYLTLFIRLATIYLSMFMINILIDGFTSNSGSVFGDTSNVATGVLLFGKLILVLGVLLFAKEAPKLFEELTGAKLSGDGGGFSPKSIGKRLAGAPLVGGALAAGAHKASQALGAGAGAAGAAFSAWRNNRAVARGGKGAEGLTHMDVKAAATQGRHNGWKKGGLKQFNAQGKKVYEDTYNYGKKQGIFGGKSLGTRMDEKYDKAYQKNVKNHAAERNAEIKAAAMEGKVPTNELQSEILNKDYKKQNADFATTSKAYKDAAAFVDNEAAKQGITLTDKERKAKINERLSQIAATTTNENEKRSINSFLKRDEISSLYENSVLSNNPEAIAKVKEQAKSQAEIIARKEIETNGIDKVITDSATRDMMEKDAKIILNNKLVQAGGDITKLNISTESMQKINAAATKEADITINSAGGIRNVEFSAAEQTKINDKLQAQMSTIVNNVSLDDAQKQDLINHLNTSGKETIMKEVLIQREQSKGIMVQAQEDSRKEAAVKIVAEQRLPEIEVKTMLNATTDALNQVKNATSEFIEGKLNGTYSDKVDGTLDELYSEEYTKNENIITNGVKNKSSQSETLDNLSKILDYQKKHDGKLPNVDEKK